MEVNHKIAKAIVWHNSTCTLLLFEDSLVYAILLQVGHRSTQMRVGFGLIMDKRFQLPVELKSYTSL